MGGCVSSLWKNNCRMPMGFSNKYKSDSSIKGIARFVAKGFTDTYGIDYQETFAVVAKMNSIRGLISCTVNLGLTRGDSNSFLHGRLTEEVYIEIPQDLIMTKGRYCKLKKALYDLKHPKDCFEGSYKT